MDDILQGPSVAKRLYRVAVLNSHPIQYFAPLYRSLAQEPEIDLTVYYCHKQGTEEYLDFGFGKRLKWDIPLLEGYRYKFLPNLSHKNQVGGFFSIINPTIVSELRRGQYDILLIHGYSYATNWLAALAASGLRIPVLLRGDSNLLRMPSPSRRVIKRMVLSAFFRMVRGFLYIGSRNYEYYRYYGVPDSKLYFTPYCVDNVHFGKLSQISQEERSALRAKLEMPKEYPVILSVGKIYDVKQPLRLLKAYHEVRKQYPCALLFVGDGPMRDDVLKEVHRKQMPNVTITGFINQSRIPEYYAAGDLLVLISWREAWGLVVNEAMNSGLPIVVSDRVGCALDLVSPDIGFIVPYNSDNAIVTVLQSLVTNPSLRAKMGHAALHRIADWGIPKYVEGILRAVRSVCGS